MRWQFELWRRERVQERLLPPLDPAARRQRWYKLGIVSVTLCVVAAMVAGTSTGRYTVASLVERVRLAAMRCLGISPAPEELVALRTLRRAKSEADSSQSLERFYRETSPDMRRLFDVAGMAPGDGLIVSGRTSNAFLLSSRVFDRDASGRQYRLTPGVRSVWLRQITLQKGPFGLFLVPDRSDVRAAAVAAGAIVDEPSKQATNSWGLRGPEPDVKADVRGIVLGDSFMQGMFNGDADTPPLKLEQALGKQWKCRVSVLNTGHIGYAPEQYYRTLLEYGAKFTPRFVVVSVCPNDFGDENDTLAGKGDDWDEAEFWIGEILQWCRSQRALCLLVPVPCDVQFLATRNSRYPGRVSDIFHASSLNYLDPLDIFIDENLRLKRELRVPDPLYNRHIADNHLSPSGAALWAQTVARRIDLTITPHPRPVGDPTPAR